DLALHTYGRAPVTVLLEIALESDFADIFEVRYRSWQRRADLNTWWLGPNILESRYQNEDFVRRCLVRAITQGAGITYANGALRIPADLVPGEEWKLCLQYDLLTSDDDLPELAVRCAFDAGEEDPMRQARAWQTSVAQIEPADIRLRFAYERWSRCAPRPSVAWTGSTAAAPATATGSRSTRRAPRGATATSPGATPTTASSTRPARSRTCLTARPRCRPTCTAPKPASRR